MKVHLIGDVHRNIAAYLQLTKELDFTIQLGDFGYQEDWDSLLGVLDPSRHRILRGNHDFPAKDSPFDLGDFGNLDFHGFSCWYMRGAFSRYPLNARRKIVDVNWWASEELSDSELYSAIEHYRQSKPRVVVSHECPSSIKQMLIQKRARDQTSLALQTCLEIHRPAIWYFGHHHTSWNFELDGTQFRCLDILEVIET